jgi:hypothetical protein
MIFGEILDIKDLGKHSAVTVILLGMVWAGTANLTPDPQAQELRPNRGSPSCLLHLRVDSYRDNLSRSFR